MNVWDIIIILLVAAAVIFAVFGARKRKHACGCGCDACTADCRKREKPAEENKPRSAPSAQAGEDADSVGHSGSYEFGDS